MAKTKWKKLGGLAPFWSPWDKKRKHPATIEGVVTAREENVPSKFKRGETSTVLTVECGEEFYKLDTKSAGLRGLAGIGTGETIMCEYKGEVKVAGRKQPMHSIECYVQDES